MKYNDSFFNGKLQSVILLTEVNFKTAIVQEKIIVARFTRCYALVNAKGK